MRIRSIVMMGLGVGAVALAVARCARSAQVFEAPSGPLAETPRTLDRRQAVDLVSDRSGQDLAGTGTLGSLAGRLTEQDGE